MMDKPLPRIIVGCWQLAHGHAAGEEAPCGPPTGEERQALLEYLHHGFEAGLTAFDCADIYTGVEELLGEFRRSCRERYGAATAATLRVHTKFVPDRDRLSRIDRAYVTQIIDRSLQRLQTERLDLVQFHWWDYDVPGYVETAQELNRLRQAGKIADIGLTNFDTPRTAEIIAAGVPLFSNQVQWSLLDQRPRKALVEFAESRGLNILCYGGLAGGFLTRRYLDTKPPAEPLANRSLVKYRLIIEEAGGWDAYQSVLRTLRDVADRHALTPAEVALTWLLAQPGVTSVIVGARSRNSHRPGAQLATTARALALSLSRDALREVDAACSRLTPIPGVIYEREREKSGPHAAIMRYNLNSSRQDQGLVDSSSDRAQNST